MTNTKRIAELKALIKSQEIRVENGATPYYHDDKLVEDNATCGTCGLTWNDALISSRTPTPGGRCPYEHIHTEIAELKKLESKLSPRERERLEAIEHLRTIIKPGDTVYTVLRHVSRSGMLRAVDVYLMKDGEPKRITWQVGKAAGIDYDRKREALKLGGCGYDVGFHTVYALSHTLFPEFRCIGEDCPANDHVNYRSVIHCRGGEDASGEHQPCFADDNGVHRLRTGVGAEFGLGIVCPTCKGKGQYVNPEHEVKKGDLHSDGGYALRHKWL